MNSCKLHDLTRSDPRPRKNDLSEPQMNEFAGCVFSDFNADVDGKPFPHSLQTWSLILSCTVYCLHMKFEVYDI